MRLANASAPGEDGAVPQRQAQRRAQADRFAQRGVAGEDRAQPAGEAPAQRVAQGLVERQELGLVAEALAVGRVGDQQAAAAAALDGAGRGHHVGQRAPLDPHPAVEAGRLHVGPRRPHRPLVLVAAGDRRKPRLPGPVAPARLGAQRLPQRRVVARPAEEAEAGAEQARRAVGGDHRRLDGQRAGATHRVEERRPRRRQRRPARRQQHRGGEVLLERSRRPVLAPAAPVQRLAGQVDAHVDGPAASVDVDAHVGRLGVDRGAEAAGVAQLVDDGVLDPLGAEAGVGDGGVGADEVDGQGAAGRQVLGPGDGLHPLVEPVVVGGGEGGER